MCTSVLDRWISNGGLIQDFKQKRTTVFLLTHLKTETRFGAKLGGGTKTHKNYSQSSKELNNKEFLNLSGIFYPMLPTTMVQKWPKKRTKCRQKFKKYWFIKIDIWFTHFNHFELKYWEVITNFTNVHNDNLGVVFTWDWVLGAGVKFFLWVKIFFNEPVFESIGFISGLDCSSRGYEKYFFYLSKK